MSKSSKTKKPLSHKGRLIIAIICFVLGIIVFIFADIGMKKSTGIGALNLPILTWMIDHRSNAVTNLAKIITSIADPYLFAIIVGVLVVTWIIVKHEIWRPVILASAVVFAAATSSLLKLHFMDARPPLLDMVPAYEHDYSFPSGHTIGMAVFLLVLGYLIYSRKYSIQKFWMWIVAAIIGTGLIGLSRLYLGYHWLTDVIASIGLALIILAIVIVVDSFYIRRYKK